MIRPDKRNIVINILIGFVGSIILIYIFNFYVDSLPWQSCGVLVVRTMPDSPASSTELKFPDIIYKVDNQTVYDMDTLSNYLASKSPGDMITAFATRKGNYKKYEIRLGFDNVTNKTWMGLQIEPVYMKFPFLCK